MKILKLTAENIKRLNVVEIAADGAPVVVIAGENEAGKSSVLDAIAMALGGKDLVPAKPIRDGQARAEIKVDLGEYIVTRVFTAAGGSLTVTNRDGAKYPSPQALLDGIVGKLTFDPLAFAEQDDKAQAETLRRLAGIDTTALDLERKKVFDERTIVNRDITRITGAVAKAPVHPDAGTELQVAANVVMALAEADQLADVAGSAERTVVTMTAMVALAKRHAAACASAVDVARQALEDAETASLEADEAVHEAARNLESARVEATTAATAVPDRTALRQQLADVEGRNAKVRDNLTRELLTEELAERTAVSAGLTERLNAIDNEKGEQLTSAAFPVPELGLDDVIGVTWNGLPFAQASSAVRVRASVAIGLALNPKLKVLLVRNGNDLGQKNLALIAEMAAVGGGQLWIERIAGGDGLPTILIEDGSVAASQTDAPSPSPKRRKQEVLA